MHLACLSIPTSPPPPPQKKRKRNTAYIKEGPREEITFDYSKNNYK